MLLSVAVQVNTIFPPESTRGDSFDCIKGQGIVYALTCASALWTKLMPHESTKLSRLATSKYPGEDTAALAAPVLPVWPLTGSCEESAKNLLICFLDRASAAAFWRPGMCAAQNQNV